MNVNTKSSNSIPDPEEGLKNFVDAVNQKDANKIYNLYSEKERANISMDYIYNSLHEGPGPIVINYTVLDKRFKGNKAWLYIRFYAEIPDYDGEIKPTPYTLTMAFILEDNQWKMSAI
jgi:ketosteroid isomerase-like protein